MTTALPTYTTSRDVTSKVQQSDQNMPNWRHIRKHLNDMPLAQID
ncbi:hypothetical protein [Brucella pseudintermedia]|nr:hypothetical protein [Brucella pseudintermedia]